MAPIWGDGRNDLKWLIRHTFRQECSTIDK